ncbi:hypothetical protein KP79_PYT14838 [Mizuhopecten yessoensis]|uniref:Uncharacterized protein n=1 Tax=Mizuhopecten yessoensis TaxID=6573 RepID=A0A210Q343_MIZYE|nr:hypothetical protein KP79_PYT14838 [Mizuhopecten yessoensis]
MVAVSMEHSVKPKHGLTEFRLHFTASDHDCGQGLLDIVDRRQVERFRRKCYSVTTPIDDVVKLYRLHGEQKSPASDVGHFWSTVPPGSNGRVDKFSNPPTIQGSAEVCANSYTADDVLIVPKGILLYEGFSSTRTRVDNENRFQDKISWQIFIPRQVVTPLLRYQRELVGGQMTEVRSQILLEKIDNIQTQLMMEWTRKYISNVLANKKFDITHLLLTGNNVINLPCEVRKLLPTFQCGVVKSSRQLSGRYTLHDETMLLPNGVTYQCSLAVTLEHDAGSTLPTCSPIRYYRVRYEWNV